MPEGPLRIGIDAGSKTVKLVVLDAQDSLVYQTYSRHKSNVRETLSHAIHTLKWMKGDFSAEFCVTGSAGIGAAKLLGVPFVQEVIAANTAVDRLNPDADAVIELGGEDAKVIYRAGGLEQRMNATCAGGTGGFLDTVAFMLGIRSEELSSVACGWRRIYPIASRCAVFAQTDIRPLLNAGATKADIAASALDAVVRQTLGGLACGRPITGNVLFLGGPLEFNPELVTRFRNALGLTRATGVKPANAQLYPAIGAALLAGGKAAIPGIETQAATSGPFLLSELEALLDDAALPFESEGLKRLPPLFDSPADLEEFRERHGRDVFPTKRLFDAQGPLYLGIDCGSTTVKLAVLDEEGNLLHNDYQASRGETIETVRKMLHELIVSLPTTAVRGAEPPYIAHAAATGYGESMLINGFGVDSGVIETVAHVRAARHVCPDATFVLDIGGQDMKALWLNGPYLSDAVLNEACSSGCGAFVDGTAHSLGSNKYRFAEAALQAQAPVDLGIRCTVFMSSQVKHAQKAGAPREDIAAGVAYSVIQNVLYRIIGRDRLGTLGDRVVVQGGTFKSDAVLRAFELLCGVQAVRSDRAHLMGAIGAALVARDRARQADPGTRSTLIGRNELQAVNPVRRSEQCTLCGNACPLMVVDFGNGRRMVTGNRCERGAAQYGGDQAPGAAKAAAKGRNLIAEEQRLLAAYGDAPADGPRGAVAVGLVDALEAYRNRPFWHTFLSRLGFSVLVPTGDDAPDLMAKAWETVPAESLCFPAKLAHAKAMALRGKGACALFMPQAQRGNHCAVSCGYGPALVDSMEFLRIGEVTAVVPELPGMRPRAIAGDPAAVDALLEALGPLGRRTGAPLSREQVAGALQEALAEQEAHQARLAASAREALAQLQADPPARAVLLTGRPYHVDPRILHGIDGMLADLGFTVLGDAGLAPFMESPAHRAEGLPEWRPGKHLLRAAHFAVAHPQVELVCLQSFGCGYDAMSLEEVRTVLERAGRPFTALKVDEMVETAHIRIRLRTLAESIESRSHAEREGTAGASVGLEMPGLPAVKGGEVQKAIAGNPPSGAGEGGLGSIGAANSPLDSGGTANGPVGAAAAVEGDAAPVRRVRALEEPLGPDDLVAARSFTVKDICFTADVLAARVIRLMREDPSIQAVVLPEVCKNCLNEAIPRMVERACGRAPAILWEPPALGGAAGEAGGASARVEREGGESFAPANVESPALGDAAPIGNGPSVLSGAKLYVPSAPSVPACGKSFAGVPAESPAAASDRPKIGIVGNALLCFDPFMNDGIVELLESLGCQAVLPNQAALHCDDVDYTGQLQRFYDQGVRQVIYLQSFGCVKGHVQARGAHYRNAERFPGMSITVLDYDPEASALNRENRVRLIAVAALMEQGKKG